MTISAAASASVAWRSPRQQERRPCVTLDSGDGGSQAESSVWRMTKRRRRPFTITSRRCTRLSRWASQLAGVQHDPMLYSYLLDPTYSSHALRDVALRRFNLKLSGATGRSLPTSRGGWPTALRDEVEQAGLPSVYDDIDLPLVPVLARMEQAGVKIDCDVLAQMSGAWSARSARKAQEIYEAAGMEFNINSPKQLGDVLFNKLNLPKPVKYGKGKTISTAVDVLEELGREPSDRRAWCWITASSRS